MKQHLILRHFLLLISSVLFSVSAMATVSPEKFGAAGNGVKDDTKALQKAIDTDLNVFLTPKKTYYITSGLKLRTGSKIYSDGSAVLKMGIKAGEFTNTNVSLRNEIKSAALWALGASSVTLSNFKIVKEWHPQHIVTAVIIRSGSYIGIHNLDLSGFSKANGIIKLDSIYYGRISRNYIHDSQTADDYQLTGITVDDDRLASGPKGGNSTDLIISQNYIRDLTVSSAMAAKSRFETDGINIAGTESNNIYVMENKLIHVGEGVDVFGQYVRVDNNYIYEPFGIGVKFVHGASHGRATGNQIFRPGLYGMVLSGSNSVSRNTMDNTFAANEIYDAGRNPYASWSQFSRAGIAVTTNGSAGFPTYNLIYNNKVDGSQNLTFGFLCEYGGNSFENNILTERPLVEGFRQCPQ